MLVYVLVSIVDYSNRKSDEICFVSLFIRSGSPAWVYLWNSQCWKCEATSWCNRFSAGDGKFLCILIYLSRLPGYPKQYLNVVHPNLKLLADLGQPIKAIASAIPPVMTFEFLNICPPLCTLQFIHSFSPSALEQSSLTLLGDKWRSQLVFQEHAMILLTRNQVLRSVLLPCHHYMGEMLEM